MVINFNYASASINLSISGEGLKIKDLINLFKKAPQLIKMYENIKLLIDCGNFIIFINQHSIKLNNNLIYIPPLQKIVSLDYRLNSFDKEIHFCQKDESHNSVIDIKPIDKQNYLMLRG